MTDEKGQTRRDRNEQFETASPPLIVPPIGRYLWDWYFAISQSIRRVRGGVCEPIPPSEIRAWQDASGQVVRAWEYATLRAMDVAYCDEMNKELTDYHARMQAEAEAARASGGKKG